MSHYFVTGGSGFVGQHLIRRLVAEGNSVTALARSSVAAETVEAIGATPLRGEVSTARRVMSSMKGADVVVHLAAFVSNRGRAEAFDAVNIKGTAEMVTAAKDAGVPVFVNVASDAVLAYGGPLVNVNEDQPLPRPTRGALPWQRSAAGEYARSKGTAETLALAASAPGFRVVSVRPRFVWGPGDLTVLPEIIETVKTGRWVWVDGGNYLTSTCHVINLVEGIILAAKNGRGGAAYFLTDGVDIDARELITRCAAAYGVAMPERSAPYRAAKLVSWTLDTVWRQLRLPGDPPISWGAFALAGNEVTLDDSRARRELGYRPLISHAEGYATLRDEA